MKKYYVVCANKCCGFCGFKFFACLSEYSAFTTGQLLQSTERGVLFDIVEVEAKNKKEAEKKAQEKYFNEVFGHHCSK